jgi:hypothetical protein
MKERDYKTYELEAETSKEACKSVVSKKGATDSSTSLSLFSDEICARIRFLIQMNKGSGT